MSIAEEFIGAERMGDWQVRASGHFSYAKSAYLYLQDILQLKSCMDPDVYQRFTGGYFSNFRSSNKLSCGTTTDMVIEQSMMKAKKIDVGLARGRSMKDSVISKGV